MSVVETVNGSNYVRRRRLCADYKCVGKLTTVEAIHPGEAKLGLGVLILPLADIERLRKVLGCAFADESPPDEPVSPSE